MEVYCGYQENADWNVGRLLDSIEEMGDLDNTLVIYIWGDNGASLEGTTTGSFNETTFLNGLVLDAEQQLALIDQYGGIEALGGDHTAPHIAAAWAHACNAPFQWGKQSASHLGGTRDPMVVAWPARLKADKEMRSQFTHCIDVRPDHPRGRRHSRARRSSTASSRSPWTARASCTRWTTPRRPNATHRSTSRCSRPRHVQGRLVGGVAAGPPPLGRLAADARASSDRTWTGIRTATSAGSCTT